MHALFSIVSFGKIQRLKTHTVLVYMFTCIKFSPSRRTGRERTNVLRSLHAYYVLPWYLEKTSLFVIQYPPRALGDHPLPGIGRVGHARRRAVSPRGHRRALSHGDDASGRVEPPGDWFFFVGARVSSRVPRARRGRRILARGRRRLPRGPDRSAEIALRHHRRERGPRRARGRTAAGEGRRSAAARRSGVVAFLGGGDVGGDLTAAAARARRTPRPSPGCPAAR